jgi:hypothetical protein
MQLSWSKCAGGEWCLLDKIDLTAVEGYGVFAIWRNGDVAHMTVVLYVGRGALAQEIARCQRDPLFQTNDLRITWATVNDVRLIDGVVAYLYRELRPLWGEVAPWSDAVRVNLPAA